jgi:Arc/MetJ family transcription regulator
MNLYEMTVAANELYDLLTSGEIDEQTFTDTLEAMGTEEKLESYCKVIRQLEADGEMLKAEKERIEKKQKAVTNSIDRMKKAVIEFMKAQGADKTSAGTFTVALSTSKATKIIDESKIPKKFFVKQEPKLDKKTILDLLKSGVKVKGCELQINEGVRIK